MPPTRTARTRTGEGTLQTNMYFGPAIFRQLTTAQLQELCRRDGLSALGRRTTLENRLKNAGIASAAAPNDQPVTKSTITFHWSSRSAARSVRIPTHSRGSKSPNSSDWSKILSQPQPETSPRKPLVQPREFCSHRHRLLHKGLHHPRP